MIAKEDMTMKAMRLMNSILVGLLLMGTVQTQAVEYKSTYKGGHPQPVYVSPTTLNAPTATFQSTSSMPVASVTASSLLNEDGTVNDEAYGVGRKPGLRRDPVAPPPNPGDPDEEEDDGNTPLGDGLWVLLLMAGGYVIARAWRRKEV